MAVSLSFEEMLLPLTGSSISGRWRLCKSAVNSPLGVAHSSCRQAAPNESPYRGWRQPLNVAVVLGLVLLGLVLLGLVLLGLGVLGLGVLARRPSGRLAGGHGAAISRGFDRHPWRDLVEPPWEPPVRRVEHVHE